MASLRERLGPQLEINLFGIKKIGIGDRLGREIGEGGRTFYGEGGDDYGDWIYVVEVVGPAKIGITLEGDFGSKPIGTYEGKAINRSPAKGCIRFI